MKKERNMGFVYFLVFIFLGFLLLASTGVYNNFVTGSAINVAPISDAIKGVLDILFNGLLKPLTTIVGGEHYELASRLVLGIILYVLISFGIGKQFDKNRGDNKNGRIISLLIAILGGSLIPRDVIVKLFNPQFGIFGNFIGLIIVLIVMVLPIYLIAKTEAKGRLGHFLKGSIYLALILIITYIQGSFINESVDIGGIVSLAYGLSILFCGIGFFYGLYKLIAPSVESATEYVKGGGGVKGQVKNLKEEAKELWRGQIERGNKPPTNQQQPQTPQQQLQIRYIPNIKKIKRRIEWYYSPMLNAHRDILNEFGKLDKGLEPDINIIQNKFKITYGYTRSIIAVINRYGLKVKDNNLNIIDSIAKSISSNIKRILKIEDINKLKRDYRIIEQQLSRIEGPISDLGR